MIKQVDGEVLRLTARIVSAHVGSRHQTPVGNLPGLIQSVYDTLAAVGSVEPAPVVQTLAVPVRKSVFPNYIVCLEDGKKLKMLKRHLKISCGMTPEQYRAKWDLPRDYPMVAPAYASLRSGFAKKTGLGRKSASQGEPRGRSRPRSNLP